MTARTTAVDDRQRLRGLWLGMLGIGVFALTLPMTRLATGTVDAPQLSPWFITFARAVIAATLSAVFLLATRSRWPRPDERGPLLLAMLGNALGFPILLGWALRYVPAGHAAVFTALLPLATAALAARVLQQRAQWGFWVCAVLGACLVLAFSLWRAAQQGHGFVLEWADALLVGAVLSAAVGYVYGAKVTPALGAERVICWMCLMTLPVSIPGALYTWPSNAVAATSWMALAYVGTFSMWAGFFAWYRGMVWGGTLRVSQLQLLQPFISMLAAVPLLGEALQASALLFALAVVATVLVGRRLAQ